MKLALEAMNAKEENKALQLMKKIEELNNSAEKTVNKAIKELPGPYKKMVGFNKFTLPTDEYGLPISNEPLIVKKVGGTKKTKSAIPLEDLTLEQEKNLIKQIKKDSLAMSKGTFKNKFLSGSAKALKTIGKVIKPVGYAVGIGAGFQAKSIADEMGIDLKPQDYFMAVDSGDAQIAINNYKRRNDPEFAAAERARDLAQMTDDFEEVGKDTTFGKYNEQIKNIKLP